MISDVSVIERLAETYFDALYLGDAERFASVFHPDARLYCNHDNEYVSMGVEEYLALVRGRENPVDRGDRRDDRILAIIQETPTTAVLRTRELFLPKRFTDELTLVKIDGQWKIVAKVWDFEILDEG